MERLAALLQELIDVLESESSDFWAHWMRESLELVKVGDYRGVEHFLSAFGGMGSFNDSASDESLAIAYPANSLARELLHSRSFFEQLTSLWPTSFRKRLFFVLGLVALAAVIISIFVGLFHGLSG